MANHTRKSLESGTGRWLKADAADAHVGAVQLTGQVGVLRETNLRRVLSQLEAQQSERELSRRYRLHGQLAPLSQLGRGPAQWTQLLDLVTQNPTAAGYTADFFRDFSYELLRPVRAVPVSGQANTYQLYYEIIPGVQLDVLSGTMSRDAWGGVLFPYAATGVVDVTDYTIAGLPVPLPVTELLVRLVGPVGTRRYDWPLDWSGEDAAPAPGSATGFLAQAVGAQLADVGAWLTSEFKPASWSTLDNGVFTARLLGQLVPVWAAYNLAFTLPNVQHNAAFVAHVLGFTGRRYQLTTDTGPQVVGPRVRFDPGKDAELVYLSWPTYGLNQALSVSDTPVNRTYLSELGYQYAASVGGALVLSFSFRWEAFHRLKLADFSDTIERVPRQHSGGEPAWSWLDPVTDEYVYRDLLASGVSQGERGVDFPFANNAHYVYERVAHYVGPDLTSFNSFRAFAHLLPSGRLLENPLSPSAVLPR